MYPTHKTSSPQTTLLRKIWLECLQQNRWHCQSNDEWIKESRSCWFYPIEFLQWFNCWLETRPQRYNRDSSQVLCITILWFGQSHSTHLSFQNFSSIGSSERVKLGKVKEVISRAAKQDSSSPIKAHDIKHLGIRGYGNKDTKEALGRGGGGIVVAEFAKGIESIRKSSLAEWAGSVRETVGVVHAYHCTHYCCCLLILLHWFASSKIAIFFLPFCLSFFVFRSPSFGCAVLWREKKKDNFHFNP